MSSDLHCDHRARLRQKFRSGGLAHFSEHEIVELLLFYVIPRKNTNEIAHALVNRFGNLRGILFAPPQELEQIFGISEQSVIFLQLLSQVYGHLQRQSLPEDVAYHTAQDVFPLARSYYSGKREECPILLLLDSRLHKMDLVPLGEGSLSAGLISANQVAQAVFSRGAYAFVLIHNHPNGDVTPSQNDLFLTNKWYYLFQSLGCPMLEHLVVTDTEYYPILEKQHGLSGLKSNTEQNQ